MINTKLLAEICEVAGAPGHEQRVREIVLREAKIFGRRNKNRQHGKRCCN